MRALTVWSRRREFWDRIPTASYVTFLAGIFLMFMPAGLLNDLSHLGSNPPSRLVAEMMLSGGLTVGYVLAFRWPRWFVPVIAIHALVITRPELVLPARTPPLAGAALYRRMQIDANLILGFLIASFAVLSHFARREGTRYVRAHTEIALARDIHRLLVPSIARRVGRFEFRGFSIPSGDVGGDLIDLVESDGHWIGYVADVSGHGVGAGLLMGMVKSAARTQLRATQALDQLLNTLNVVLFYLRTTRRSDAALDSSRRLRSDRKCGRFRSCNALVNTGLNLRNRAAIRTLRAQGCVVETVSGFVGLRSVSLPTSY